MNFYKLSLVLYPTLPGPAPRKPLEGMDKLQIEVEKYIMYRSVMAWGYCVWNDSMLLPYYKALQYVKNILEYENFKSYTEEILKGRHCRMTAHKWNFHK